MSHQPFTISEAGVSRYHAAIGYSMIGNGLKYINNAPEKQYIGTLNITANSREELDAKHKLISTAMDKLPDIMEKIEYLETEIRKLKLAPICQEVRLIPERGVDYFTGKTNFEDAKNSQ